MCPSPTGYFHVGGARTALYNWVLARQQGGVFVMRIEDTDAERNREEWVEGIHEAMRWLGLDWDEYYRQSERLPLYADAAKRLYDAGAAYYCDCTREAVLERTKDNPTPGYDRFCRDRGLEPGPGRALRFKTPREGTTTVVDVVRGEPAFENATIEDFVLQRGDGSPLFLLANVVDDIDMRISHVVRGEEHLPNTPKYMLLWAALGGPELPVFAHLPNLVNAKRQKLSKRRSGDKVEVEVYREEGFLPEAMVNFLALLGWSPGDDREFLSREEMVAEFKLEAVVHSPAFFDEKKLCHFNGHYLRDMPLDAFIAVATPFLEGAPWADHFDPAVFARLAADVQTRVEVLSEVPEMVDFIFLPEAPEDADAWAKTMNSPIAAPMLDGALAAYENCPWEADAIMEATWRVAEPLDAKKAKAQAPIRVAVTGRTVGPPLFPAMEVLGRDRTLQRLRAARARLD